LRQVGGASLEKTVMEVFKRYWQRGIHCQQNHPEKLQDGTCVRKHGFDFQIFHENIFYAFDAKYCQGKRFSLTTNCKQHQIKAMHDIENHGGEGFFLIYFAESKKLNRLNAEEVITLLENGVKSIEFNEEKVIDIDILGILK